MPLQTMTKDEAIAAMRKGKKVTHKYFSRDEWVSMDGSEIVTEEGYHVTMELFWDCRNQPYWNTGWKLWEPLKK